MTIVLYWKTPKLPGVLGYGPLADRPSSGNLEVDSFDSASQRPRTTLSVLVYKYGYVLLGGFVKPLKEAIEVLTSELPLKRSSPLLVMAFEIVKLLGKGRQRGKIIGGVRTLR